MPDGYIVKRWIICHKGTIAHGAYCPYCGKYGDDEGYLTHCPHCGKYVVPLYQEIPNRKD